ncbi:MAG: hypothetical protein RR754_05320, partial [Oscillospiraceae bacterium]
RLLQLQRPLFLCPVLEKVTVFSFQQIKLKMLKVSRPHCKMHLYFILQSTTLLSTNKSKNVESMPRLLQIAICLA